jgi:repressor LexA
VNLGGRYVPSRMRSGRRGRNVPLLGTVAAGSPILAAQNLDGYIAYLPRFGDSQDLFALRVKGDSMIEAAYSAATSSLWSVRPK